MIQIDLRGAGSVRQEEVDAAKEYGSIMITTSEVHKYGIEEVIARIPESDRCYIS